MRWLGGKGGALSHDEGGSGMELVGMEQATVSDQMCGGLAEAGHKMAIAVTKKEDLKYLNEGLHKVEIPKDVRVTVARQICNAAQRRNLEITRETMDRISPYLKRGWKKTFK
ncbi:hypothetical protein E2562_000922 [Oryza meyeriana var. granulata]|uniref:Uncharacterized protein n=1 Tax=Oryza meyeriana var. granulata TaxID=110450 RepID=A0A6G1CX01_9ORYZ|nr:hypothetical protein E2562_000922 [Oryza meyeriana var. granulata]